MLFAVAHGGGSWDKVGREDISGLCSRITSGVSSLAEAIDGASQRVNSVGGREKDRPAIRGHFVMSWRRQGHAVSMIIVASWRRSQSEHVHREDAKFRHTTEYAAGRAR
jgi:hypothetical protein